MQALFWELCFGTDTLLPIWNWGTEKLSNMYKVTQLIIAGIQAGWFQTCNYLLCCCLLCMWLFSGLQRTFITFTSLDLGYSTRMCKVCLCTHIFIHYKIKLSALVDNTYVYWAKKIHWDYKINGVHKVHVYIVVNSFNSFISFPKSVENSSKLRCFWKYTSIC